MLSINETLKNRSLCLKSIMKIDIKID